MPNLRSRWLVPSVLYLLLSGCSGAAGDSDAPGAAEVRAGLTSPAIYVDCAATVDGAGTSASPVRTIRAAMGLVAPGGAIYIRPGTCVERVDVNKNDIVIERDPATTGVATVAGNSPIRVDYTMPGCDPGQPTGRACNELWRPHLATFDLYDVHGVTIRNLQISQDQNVYCAAAAHNEGCTYAVTTSGGGVTTTNTYVQDLAAANPAYDQTCITEGNTCVELPTPNAGFSGLTTGCCVTPTGTVCGAGQNLAYTVTPHVCGRPLVAISGVEISGDSHAIRVENNDLTGIRRGVRTKWITYALPIIVATRESDAKVVQDIHIVNNVLHDLLPRDIDGDTFGGLTITASDNVDGFEAGNNTLTNVNGSISINGNYAFADRGAGTPTLSAAFDRVRNSWIHDNTITSAQTMGIYVDGATRALIERNKILDSQFGIGVVTEVRYETAAGLVEPLSFASDIYVRDNMVISSGAPVFGIPGGLAFATGMWLTAPGRANYNPVRNVNVTNNTFALTTQNTGSLNSAVVILPGVQGASSFAGNLVLHNAPAPPLGGTGVGLLVNGNTNALFPSTMTYSTNHYYATLGGVAAPTAFLVNGAYATLPGFQAAFPDNKALFRNPLLAGTITTFAGTKLTSLSPARNRGPSAGFAPPSWIVGSPLLTTEKDAFGSKRVCQQAVDVGADEYNTWSCP